MSLTAAYALSSAVPLWLVLLVSGEPGPAATASAEQAAHLQNFDRLARAGHLQVVGPVADESPDCVRGIAVLRAADPEEVQRHFQDDPLVSRGRLRPVVRRVHSFRGEARLAGVDPAQVVAYRLVWLRHREGAHRFEPNILSGLLGSADRALNSAPKEALWTALVGGPERTEMIAVCPDAGTEPVVRWARTLAIHEAGLTRLDVLPFYTMRGAFASGLE
ncbi:MAG: YciI family protein [Fimbriimonadaceae bacterium]|nr:YciI family protein [Fimbriimonadaceae bacterium]